MVVGVPSTRETWSFAPSPAFDANNLRIHPVPDSLFFDIRRGAGTDPNPVESCSKIWFGRQSGSAPEIA